MDGNTASVEMQRYILVVYSITHDDRITMSTATLTNEYFLQHFHDLLQKQSLKTRGISITSLI